MRLYPNREIVEPSHGQKDISSIFGRRDCRRNNGKVMSRLEACWHYHVRKTSQIGLKILSYHPRSHTWYVTLTRGGHCCYLGAFRSHEDALTAYRTAEKRLSRRASALNVECVKNKISVRFS